VFVLGVIAADLVLDRLTKLAAIELLAGAPPRDLAGGLVRLLYQENHGAMLSLGADLPESIRFLFFGVMVMVVLTGLLVFVLWKPAVSRTEALAAALVIGGGFGNVIDRWFFNGAVIDFLNVGIDGVRTGIFNLADVSILAGVIAFVLRRTVARHFVDSHK
jgi:signal peptidase II